MKTDKQLKVFEGSGSGKLTGKRWLLALVIGGGVGYAAYLLRDLVSSMEIAGVLGEVIRFTLNIWFVLPVIAFFVAARVLKPSYHVRFELGDYGLFKYYKNGRLYRTFPLKSCEVNLKYEGRYNEETGETAGYPKIELYISYQGDAFGGPERITIDCAPLGIKQAKEMWDEIERL